MSYRLIESLHGHVGILALALLIHPAILLWRGAPLSRGGRWAVGLSGLMTTLAFGIGVGIYGAYRSLVKPGLFTADASAGWLFETKEHLGYVAVTLAIGATLLALLAPPKAAELRRAAARLYVAATIATLLTAALGTWVASVRGFPE